MGVKNSLNELRACDIYNKFYLKKKTIILYNKNEVNQRYVLRLVLYPCILFMLD